MDPVAPQTKRGARTERQTAVRRHDDPHEIARQLVDAKMQQRRGAERLHDLDAARRVAVRRHELDVVWTDAKHDVADRDVHPGLCVQIDDSCRRLKAQPARFQGEHPWPQVHRRRSEERRHRQVRGPVEQLHRRSDLLDRAGAHDGDPRAERHRLLLIVRHVDHRRAQPAVQQRELRAGARAQQRIEIGQRLVEQEPFRLADDRPAKRHPLPLAAGQLRRLAIEQRREPQGGSRLSDASGDHRR